MKKYLKNFLLILFILLILIFVSIIIWLVYQFEREPVSALDKGEFVPTVVSEQTEKIALHDENRYYSDFLLHHQNIDTVSITVSLPETIPEGGLPVVIILGGLEIGRKSLSYIPVQRDNVLISYEYPYSPEYWYDNTKITQIPIIRKAVLAVPAQVEAVARWALKQSWSDHSRISILGYSFGALFVPAVYHLADEHELTLGPAVIAYGGVDISNILRHNLRNMSPVLRQMVGWTAAASIYPVEPALHVSHLNKDVLLINGEGDNQIPENSWRRLHQLVPEPKTIITMDAGHMHPQNRDLTRELIRISTRWLLERNAINP